MEQLQQYLQQLEWDKLIPEFIGKGLGFLFGFAASWYLLFRRRLQELRRLQTGDSDDVLFQMHQLVPVEGSDEVTLIFRNLGPRTTVNSLYDNEAARNLVKDLASKTTIQDPILRTEGTMGFEVLNDAFSYIAGHLAISPFPREQWLFVMTCEDRQVVRKKCVRCFLVKPADMARFAESRWCLSKVRVEKPWHAIRITALHRIALYWKQEQELIKNEPKDDLHLPLVDKQMRHERVRMMSVGISPDEKIVGEPLKVDWETLMARLKALGLETKN
ncbi:MAG: hypothetical protein AB7K24_28670 [Gemmataceae bacterium]